MADYFRVLAAPYEWTLCTAGALFLGAWLDVWLGEDE